MKGCAYSSHLCLCPLRHKLNLPQHNPGFVLHKPQSLIQNLSLRLHCRLSILSRDSSDVISALSDSFNAKKQLPNIYLLAQPKLDEPQQTRSNLIIISILRIHDWQRPILII